MSRNPPRSNFAKQAYYLGVAVEHRESFYRGQDEAIAKHGEAMGPIKWGELKKAQQLSANNKWHMLQSLAFGLVSVNEFLREILKVKQEQLATQRETNNLLRQLVSRGL